MTQTVDTSSNRKRDWCVVKRSRTVQKIFRDTHKVLRDFMFHSRFSNLQISVVKQKKS